jgi:hypothetical protein
MAIVKDWALEAAEETWDWIKSTDSYLPMDIRAIILKHCPMLPDVAYMPVPRCETCAHWTQREHDKTTGICGLDVTPSHKMWPDMYDNIVTTEDFGCVQWKKK